MRIGDRINCKRKESNLTLEELSAKVGVTRQTLSRYETGVIKSIPSDQIELLAVALHTTPAYLMGWEEPEQKNILSIPGIAAPPRTVKRPRLGTIACGQPIIAAENIECYDDVPENIRCDFTLICKGDSMIGARILDGDVVYIRQQPEVENGEIAAVLIDGTETTLKRVYIADGIVTLQAENPAFAPMNIMPDRQFAILGKAVGFTSTIK